MPKDGDLLTPTLTSHRPRDYTGMQERPPWRAGSLVYPAILGGPLALLILGPIEARRLRAPRATTWKIVAICLAALVLGLAVYAALDADAAYLTLQVAGFLAFAGVWRLLRAPDRVHAVFSPHTDAEDDYESILGAAVGAVFVAIVLNSILLSSEIQL